MEKICIAKRRKKDGEFAFSGFDSLELPGNRHGGIDPVYTVTDVLFMGRKDGDPGCDFSGEHRFSVELTPAQTATLESVGWLTCLSGAKREQAALNVVEEKKKIIFNFLFKTVPPVTMLSVTDVCRMLAVSPSFLRRLAKSGRMKSYKIGRLRRFLLDDILDYMGRTMCTSQPDNVGEDR